MWSLLKKHPVLRLLAFGQVALLAHRHLRALDKAERLRLIEFARRPHRLSADERSELRALMARLEPARFATHAARDVTGFGGGRRKR